MNDILSTGTLQLFFYLQILDVLTTLMGFRMGLSEASPFVAYLLKAGPVLGLVASKVVAFGLGALCVRRGRLKTLAMANYWYAGLVIWNLALIVQR